MTDNVIIDYSKYGNNQVIDNAKFELVEDVVLKLQCDMENKEITIAMADEDTETTELSGILSEEKLTTLVRILNQLKSQIKQ